MATSAFPLTRDEGLGRGCRPQNLPGLVERHPATTDTYDADQITARSIRAVLDGQAADTFYAYGSSTDRVAKVYRWPDPGLVQVVYPRGHFGDEDAEVVDLATAAEHLNAYLFGLEMVEDLTFFYEWINQADRPCSVIEVKRTRFRIAFTMPNCEQGGWRKGTVIKGRMFYRPR